MLNQANYNSFSGVISVCLKTIDTVNLKLLSFCMYTACFSFEFQKFRIFKILNFQTCEDRVDNKSPDCRWEKVKIKVDRGVLLILYRTFVRIA